VRFHELNNRKSGKRKEEREKKIGRDPLELLTVELK
jgi:hypothetical protein